MNGANRLWVLGTVVLAIALIAAGWFLGISPKIDEMNASNEQKVGVDAQNLAAQARLTQLAAEYKNLAQVMSQLEELRVSLPPDADYQGFLTALNKIARDNHATITSFAPGAPVTIGSAASTAVPSPSPTTTADPTLPDGTLVTIPIKLSASGDFDDLLGFIRDAQASSRLFLVGSIDLGQKEGTASLTLDGFIYVVIDATVASSGVNGPAPTISPTPTPTSTNP